jgi:hypothetical protein
MLLIESLLYDIDNSKTLFCYYEIGEEKYANSKIYYLSYIEGEIGENNSFEVQSSEYLNEIKVIEKLLLDKYKLTINPNTQITLKISLNSKKFASVRKIYDFIKQVTSGIKHICKTTGAGIVKFNFISDIEISTAEITFIFDIVFSDKFEEYFINDLRIIGVNSSDINITISNI